MTLTLPTLMDSSNDFSLIPRITVYDITHFMSKVLNFALQRNGIIKPEEDGRLQLTACSSLVDGYFQDLHDYKRFLNNLKSTHFIDTS